MPPVFNSLREPLPIALTLRVPQLLPASKAPLQEPARSITFAAPTPSTVRSQNPPLPSPQKAGVQPTRFHLRVQETRLLLAQENVHRVVPDKAQVCDVLVLNTREIAVIGKQPGTARLDFWYDGQGLRRVSYLVTVGGDLPPRIGPLSDLQKVETLIRHLFPGSRVDCHREQDRLIVRGAAVSRQQAIDILAMVRRSQLIPVVDQIVIQHKKE